MTFHGTMKRAVVIPRRVKSGSVKVAGCWSLIPTRGSHDPCRSRAAGEGTRARPRVALRCGVWRPPRRSRTRIRRAVRWPASSVTVTRTERRVPSSDRRARAEPALTVSRSLEPRRGGTLNLSARTRRARARTAHVVAGQLTATRRKTNRPRRSSTADVLRGPVIRGLGGFGDSSGLSGFGGLGGFGFSSSGGHGSPG